MKRVVGTSRPPSLSDRDQMPYTEAAIHEVMRSRPLLPNGVYHSTVEDVQFHGYNIPKDTMVFYNIFEAHYNSDLWGDPENFRPERFLSKDGTTVERRDGFMPFSTGKRICLGERLARDTLFLFTASFFQVFRVAPDPNGPPLDVEFRVRGTVPFPKPHKLVLTLREGWWCERIGVCRPELNWRLSILWLLVMSYFQVLVSSAIFNWNMNITYVKCNL